MCQAYEGERRCIVRGELNEIRETWRKHQTGEAPLTEKQQIELVVRKMMLEE
jgi:hypothetical protein